MSKIDRIIPVSNFETIRSKIAQILAIELANQKTLLTAWIATEEAKDEEDQDADTLEDYKLYLSSIPSVVYEERGLRPSSADLPYLNVLFIKSPQNDMITHTTQTGDNLYMVESWQNGKTTSSKRGDQLASHRVQRLLGACARILNDPVYVKLDLGVLIGYKHVSTIQVAQPEKAQNTDNEIWGKFDVTVKVNEASIIPTYSLFEGNDTTVSFENSEKGYYWTIN